MITILWTNIEDVIGGKTVLGIIRDQRIKWLGYIWKSETGAKIME